jgi:hypothetical protein
MRMTLMWFGRASFPMRQRYEEIADKHPDFIAARQKMSTVTRKPAERRYYQLHFGR